MQTDYDQKEMNKLLNLIKLYKQTILYLNAIDYSIIHINSFVNITSHHHNISGRILS